VEYCITTLAESFVPGELQNAEAGPNGVVASMEARRAESLLLAG